jgi:hypothetical protein
MKTPWLIDLWGDIGKTLQTINWFHEIFYKRVT